MVLVRNIEGCRKNLPLHWPVFWPEVPQGFLFLNVRGKFAPLFRHELTVKMEVSPLPSGNRSSPHQTSYKCVFRSNIESLISEVLFHLAHVNAILTVFQLNMSPTLCQYFSCFSFVTALDNGTL